MKVLTTRDVSMNMRDECRNDLVYGHTTLIEKKGKNEKKLLESLVASSGRISSLARS